MERPQRPAAGAWPPPRALLFDLDGTLVDSRRDLATAVNAVRRELGLEALPEARVVSMVGEGARLLVRRALGGEVGDELEDEALARFLACYERVATATTRPYPGVGEMLARLAERFPLGLLSNKPEGLCRLILRHLDLERSFHAVVGGDTLEVRKPDPATVVHLARRLGCAAGEVVLVGDSRIDADTAAAAGCRFVLVEWGFARPPERVALGVELRAGDAPALTALLLALGGSAGR